MNWFKEMLSGTSGDVSSKRFLGLILILLWTGYFISNLYWGYTIKASLEEYTFYLLNAVVLAVTIERFAPKKADQLPKT